MQRTLPSPRKLPSRVLPTGVCWCGCEADVARGSFFLPGHDKVAESAVVMSIFGGVPELLLAFDFGPGNKNPKDELIRYRREHGGRRA